MAAPALRNQEASCSTRRCSYLVFLSCSGKDACAAFTDHLHTSLLNAGFQTFKAGDDEDDGDESGESTRSELTRKAAEESRLAIVVFSQGYASSRRRLDLLVRILECKKKTGLLVLPVFYDLDPSQVRKQSGSFKEAFSAYEEKFKVGEETNNNEWVEKVKTWKVALSEVADLSGMVLQNQADGHESKFIQEIIEEIGNKLHRPILNVAHHPVGLDSRIRSIDSWVQDGSMDVGIMVIHGLGGIGKTTIAKAVYNLNLHRFDGSSFLANVREVSEQFNGLVGLQRQMISDVLNKKLKKIYNADEGIMKIKDAISCKRVLVVFDDVDDLDQLDSVLGMRDWFYPGSKIIITTRQDQLLKAHEVCEMRKVKELEDKEALQLFSWHAFGQDDPIEEYSQISTNVMYYCGGLPLALQVVGSSLSGRSMEVWRSALRKLEAIPDGQILKLLKISFDSLEDDHDKNLFLDLACFFVGKDKDYVIALLDCDFYPIVGIQNLTDRCLLTFGKDGKLLVHQLIQDMAREIIRQESPWDPGRRSRVWHHKDSFRVLNEETGTERIRGLVLNTKMLKGLRSVNVDAAKRRPSEEIVELLMADQFYPGKRRRLDVFRLSVDEDPKYSNEIEFKTNAFDRMQQLRILHLTYVQLTGCYEQFPKELRWLYWRGFPLKSIPGDLSLEGLVALDMRNSGLEQVWKETKFLGLLKILNLSHSHSLRTTPDFTGLPNLHRLILKSCIKLVELHKSIGGLKKLVVLNLRGCKYLRRLPRNISNLKSLEKLIISGCTKLAVSPMELGKLESLKILHADGIDVSQLASATGEEKSWPDLFMPWASITRRQPESFKSQPAFLSQSLTRLSLEKCNLLDDAIISTGILTSLSLLQYLNLSHNPMSSLPQSISGLPMLQDLWMDSCTNLQALPELPSSLVTLKAVNCKSLKNVKNLPNLMKSLFLDLSGCEKLDEVQGLFKLEPIGNFEAEMISEFGFHSLDSIKNSEVELYNKMTTTRNRGLVQGFYEFGIFSTYLPGNEILGPANYKVTEESVVSLDVSSHPNGKIRGLNFRIVYARSRDCKFRFWEGQSWYTFYIKICNKTRGLKWVYGPTFIGIPEQNQEMTYLSHWKIGDQLEIGDQVSASVVAWSPTFQLKEFGVSQVHDQMLQSNSEDQKGKLFQNKTMCAYNNKNFLDGGEVTKYQMAENAYFLSHPEYFILRGNPERAQVLYCNLFEDRPIFLGDSHGGEYDSDSWYDDNSIEEFDEEEELQLLSELWP